MKSSLLMISLALANPVIAELLPQLETLAKHQKELAAGLSDERAKEIIKLQDLYIKELTVVESKATEDGNIGLVKLLKTEEQQLKNGPIPPNPPDALPRGLHGSRKTYLRNYERMEAAFNKRRTGVDSAYLAQLGKLQKEHAADATWTEQIASEKERVLAGSWGPITNMATGLSGTKWLNNNNGTETRSFNTDGKVDGKWKYEIKDPVTVIIHFGADNHMPMHLQKDGKTLSDYNGTWTLLPKSGN